MKVLYNAPVAVRKETSMLKDVPKKAAGARAMITGAAKPLSLIHISEPTRPY